MNNESVIIERTFKVPVERVWKAITDKDEMKLWYFDLAEFKAETGFEFQFDGGTEYVIYTHLCKITDVVINKKLAYTWRYQGFPGCSHLTFELFPEGGGTRLKLTHRDIGTFPADNPDFARENFVEGWNDIIGNSLPEYLKKG